MSVFRDLIKPMICQFTQGFYDNLNPFYGQSGLKGHGANDVVCGYGTPVECPLDIEVYKILDDKHPSNDGTGFWAVFGIGQYKGQLGELCLGHPSKILCDVGSIKKGQVFAQEGNHGKIYYGSIEITKAMQEAGDKRGSHRHWQWRPLKKSPSISSSKVYITATDGSIYRDKNDFAYEIPNYYNGFHGLSPDIANILSDYDEFKMNSAIIRQASVEEKISFIKILQAFKEILIGVFNKKNE